VDLKGHYRKRGAQVVSGIAIKEPSNLLGSRPPPRGCRKRENLKGEKLDTAGLPWIYVLGSTRLKRGHE